MSRFSLVSFKLVFSFQQFVYDVFIYLKNELQLIYNMVLVSGTQQSNSEFIYIYVCVYIYVCMYVYVSGKEYIYILFCYKLLQDIVYGSLCYAVNPLFIYFIYSGIHINLILLIYPSPLIPWVMIMFSMFVSLFLFYK